VLTIIILALLTSNITYKQNIKPLTVYEEKMLVMDETFAEKIKAHWLIENQVHWVKDVNFNKNNGYLLLSINIKIVHV